MSTREERNKVTYILNRIIELSEDLDECARIRFKTRVQSMYAYNTLKQNIYTLTLSKGFITVNCLVARAGSYHSLLSELHKELVENPEYIGIQKDDIETSIEVFSNTLDGLKKKRERLNYTLGNVSELTTKEITDTMPTWMIKDFMGGVLLKFSKHFKEKQDALSGKNTELKVILDTLDTVEGYLMLSGIASEGAFKAKSCLLLKVPQEGSEDVGGTEEVAETDEE